MSKRPKDPLERRIWDLEQKEGLQEAKRAARALPKSYEMGMDIPAASTPQAFQRMSHGHRLKIQNSRVLDKLIAFAEGKPEAVMLPHQVTAALGLLRKVLPDLAATGDVASDGGIEKPLETMSNAELEAILKDARSRREGSSGTPAPPSGAGKPH